MTFTRFATTEELEEILRELTRLPEAIRRRQDDIRSINIEATESAIKLREIEIASEIQNELDAAGKPKYKNEAAREIAVAMKLRDDTEYQAWQTEHRERKQERQQLESDQWLDKDRFKAVGIKAQLLAALITAETVARQTAKEITNV